DVAVDATHSRHAGNVYAAWDELAPPTKGGFPRDLLRVSRSTDHGRTFSAPKAASEIHHTQAPDIAVGPDGRVYLAFQVDGQFWLSISNDGGRIFGRPNLVANVIPFDSYQFRPMGETRCRRGPSHCLPAYTFPRCDTSQAVAVDGSGVHIVWSARNTQNEAKIFIDTSPDGRTWSNPPRQIDDAPVGHE